MEDIKLLSQEAQEMINGLRDKEKSLLSEAELALLSARQDYLTEEEKEKFFKKETQKESRLRRMFS